MTICGILISVFVFTLSVSLGNPQSLADISIRDWFVASLLGFFALGVLGTLARLL